MTVELKLTIAGYFLAAVLHVVGLLLLYRAKLQMKNQKMIIMNLSVSEMLFCFFKFLHYLHILFLSSSIFYFVTVGITTISFCAVRLAIFHFIIDRFLGVWLNLKYPLYFSKKILIIIIVTQWILGFIFVAVLFTLISLTIIGWYTVVIIRLSMDVIIIISALLTFPYLFLKVRNTIQVNNNTQRRPYRLLYALLKIKVLLLMVITFAAFNTSSTVIWFRASSRNIPLSYVFQVLDICGWASDALIYVFLQKRVRQLLFSSCRKGNRIQVGGTNTLTKSYAA